MFQLLLSSLLIIPNNLERGKCNTICFRFLGIQKKDKLHHLVCLNPIPPKWIPSLHSFLSALPSQHPIGRTMSKPYIFPFSTILYYVCHNTSVTTVSLGLCTLHQKTNPKIFAKINYLFTTFSLRWKIKLVHILHTYIYMVTCVRAISCICHSEMIHAKITPLQRSKRVFVTTKSLHLLDEWREFILGNIYP